jgi:transposase
MGTSRFVRAHLTPEVILNTPWFMLSYVHVLREEIVHLKTRIDLLEAKLRQNSTNSNRPPSSDSPFIKEPENKPRGIKSKNKRKGYRQQCLRPTEIQELFPERCTCGCVGIDDIEPYYVHQVIEFPEIQLKVKHIILYRGRCQRCGKIVKTLVSPEQRTGFGPRLSSVIAVMVGTQADSRRTVQDFCGSVLGLSISQGAIQKIIDRMSAALVPHYETIAEVARNSPINHLDETSWRCKGMLQWLWVMGNQLVAFFMIHPNRSKKAFEALIKDWNGILVSDGYGVYAKWVGLRQACLAHLIRQAKGLSERKDVEIAKCGAWAHDELVRLCHMANAPPSSGEWNMWYARFIHLTSLYSNRQDDAGKLTRRLVGEMDHLWLFLKEAGVAPTNNLAERLLRFAVLWRKGSFGTASEKGNRWTERILSLRQTCRLRRKRIFPVLVDAMESYFMDKKPDVAWILQS